MVVPGGRARGGTLEPPTWPPEDGYRKVSDGWRASDLSADWLYKPASGIFYHTPTETLWKRNVKEPGRYLQVTIGESLSGLTHVAALGPFGVACGGARKVLLRTCFVHWRKEVVKFDEMEKDLADACEQCEESPMAFRPRTSPPCRDDVENTLRSSNEGVCHVATWKSEGASSGGILSRLFAWVPLDLLDPPDPPPTLLPLTQSSMVRITMQPVPQSSLKQEAAQKALQKEFAKGEKGMHPEAIAAVHKERCEGWRRHEREHRAVIEERCCVREGDVVVFDGGERNGVIGRAYAERDEYVVFVKGQVVNDAKGRVRYFKADDVCLATEVPSGPRSSREVETRE